MMKEWTAPLPLFASVLSEADHVRVKNIIDRANLELANARGARDEALKATKGKKQDGKKAAASRRT
jgi:hypothetical protein